ncbi:MAG: beta-N-acetylglucosaminidase domain-containing protein, partial [Muribaculaceae bacterium]
VKGEGTLDVRSGYKLVDKKKRFSEQQAMLAAEGMKFAASGAKLEVDFDAKKAVKNGVKATSGAYTMTIGKKGVSILGYDARGAFYGLQTLRQIMESPVGKSGAVPYMTINDYPDLENRGVVEGFYGTPWSHEVRLSLIDFYGKFKMNTYLYGPKDDHYHSCPNWRLPYPEVEAKQIKDLVDACNRNFVDFVWAIHPGQDIKWNEEDYKNLVNKFNLMYDLGVRTFAIFFDDISGEGTNPVKQTELLNRLHKEFVEAKGDVNPLTVCPTDYSRLWANPTEKGSLAIYGNTLHPSIKVFWTGDVVCSDLTRETMDWVNSRIKRPAYYWWNFPVTDYARHIIMQGPTYGLDTTLTSENLSGLVSNPMEHGEASKLALYGVGDYCWNTSAYNPIDNWERGIAELTPEARDAYRTFSIHSCDTETGYRRAESWETKTFSINDYTPAEFDALYAEFTRVANAEAGMKAKCTNKLLMKELAPWLEEFTKLGKRGLRALDLLKLYKQGNNAEFWKGYVGNLMTGEELKAYEAHKSGTMKLQPFYETSMDDMRDQFFISLTGKRPATLKGCGSFATLRTTQSKLMFDNDSATYYHSGAAQSKKGGEWFGVDMGTVKDVWEVKILQGRNSVDDVDYFDHARLEYSADGKTWHTLIDDMVKQYIINWKGDAVQARYIRLVKLPSEKTNWVAVRSFEVNPVNAEQLGFAVAADDAQAALYAFDNHPGTSYKNKGTIAFEVPAGVKAYTYLAKLDGKSVTVKQFDAKGNEVASEEVSSPLFKQTIKPGAVKVALTGNAEIYEIVPSK